MNNADIFQLELMGILLWFIFLSYTMYLIPKEEKQKKQNLIRAKVKIENTTN